jgi:hypothetical protein
LLQAIARLPCRSHFAVHADQSGPLRNRGNPCLVLLLSEIVSLNKFAVNQKNADSVLLQKRNYCCAAAVIFTPFAEMRGNGSAGIERNLFSNFSEQRRCAMERPR